MGGEGVAESVAAHALGEAGTEGGRPDGALKDGFVKMVAAPLAGQAVHV